MVITHKAIDKNIYWWVQVHSETHLDDWLKDYFSGLEMQRQSNGTTILTGKMQDLPEVYGLILKLRDSGVVFLSLHVEQVQKGQPPNLNQERNKTAGRDHNINISYPRYFG